MTEVQKKRLIELRCKAWGITEDEYYCNQCSDFSLEDMARAYRRGKNKGARDKAIQNVGFYQKQMEDIYDKKNKQIAELDKENAELKEAIKHFNPCGEWNDDVHDCEFRHYAMEYGSKLTKAKVCLEQLVSEITVGELEVDPNILQQAENFLKEE